MNTNEPTITVNENTTLEEIIRQLDELGLLIIPHPAVYEYRIYYEESGNITAAAESVKDAETYGFTGDYILVDEDTYRSVCSSPGRHLIQKNKVSVRLDNLSQTPQLEKSQSGFATVKNAPGILLEEGETYKDVEHYDYKNS